MATSKPLSSETSPANLAGLVQAAQAGAQALMQYLLKTPSSQYDRKDFQKKMVALPWNLLTRTLDYLLLQLAHEEAKREASGSSPSTTTPRTSSSASSSATLRDQIGSERWTKRRAHFHATFFVLLRACAYKAERSQSHPSKGTLPAAFHYFLSVERLERLIRVLLAEIPNGPSTLVFAALETLCFLCEHAGPIPQPAPTSSPATATPNGKLRTAAQSNRSKSPRPYAAFAQDILFSQIEAQNVYTYLLTLAQKGDYPLRNLVLRIAQATWERFHRFLWNSAQLSLLIKIMTAEPPGGGTPDWLHELSERPSLKFRAACAQLLYRLFRMEPTTVNLIPVGSTTALVKLWRTLALLVLQVLPTPPSDAVGALLPLVKRMFYLLTEIVVILNQQLSINCDIFAKALCPAPCTQVTYHLGRILVESIQTGSAGDRSHLLWLWWLLRALFHIMNTAGANGISFPDTDRLTTLTIQLLRILVAHRFEPPSTPSSNPTAQLYVPPEGGVTPPPAAAQDPGIWNWTLGTGCPEQLRLCLEDYRQAAAHGQWLADPIGGPQLALGDPAAPRTPILPSQNLALDAMGVTLHTAVPLIYEMVKFFSRAYQASAGPHAPHGVLVVLCSLFIQVHHIIRDVPPAEASARTLAEVTKLRISLLRLFYNCFRSSGGQRLDVLPAEAHILSEVTQTLLEYVFEAPPPPPVVSPEPTAHPIVRRTPNDSQQQDPAAYLRHEALRVLVVMARHPYCRVHLAAAPSALAFLQYNLTIWVMMDFRGPKSRPHDRTLQQAELLLQYIYYTLQDPIYRVKIRTDHRLAVFFILSYASAVRYTEQPTTHAERAVLRVILVDLFKCYESFYRDTGLLDTLFRCPRSALVAKPPTETAATSFWQLGSTPLTDVSRCLLTPNHLSFLTCLIHVLSNWSTTSTGQSGPTSSGSPSLPQDVEYAAPGGRDASCSGDASTQHIPTSKATEQWKISTSALSFRDMVLFQMATMLQQLMSVTACLSAVALNPTMMALVARRWRDTKYDTEGLGKPLLRILVTCVSSPYWMDMVRQDILTHLFAELLGIVPASSATPLSSPTRSPPDALSPVASGPSPPTPRISSTPDPLAKLVVCNTWVPGWQDLQPFVGALQNQISAILAHASFKGDPNVGPTSTLQDLAAKALAYCSPRPQQSELLGAYGDHPADTEGGVLAQRSPLGTLFRMLLPLEGATNHPSPLIVDPCQPLPRRQPSIILSGSGSGYRPPHSTAHETHSLLSRQLLRNEWLLSETEDFVSACQAIQYLAWLRQAEFGQAIMDGQRTVQGQCQVSLADLVTRLAALPGDLAVTISCAPVERCTFLLPDRRINDPLVRCYATGSIDDMTGNPEKLLRERSALMPIDEFSKIQLRNGQSVVILNFPSTRSPTWGVQLEVPRVLLTAISPVFDAMLSGPFVEARSGQVRFSDPRLTWLDFLDILFVALQLRHIGRQDPAYYPWNQTQTEDFTELIQGGYYDTPATVIPAATATVTNGYSNGEGAEPGTAGQTTSNPADNNSSSNTMTMQESCQLFLPWLFPVERGAGYRLRRLFRSADRFLVEPIQHANCVITPPNPRH
ncbi:hypothetical protein BJ085DRAFT_39564 [Dimargaris cristalligena]|uniref:Uncharacterized protein n=1 Tax=Dimargaris cristalligena TaxID=215637 RepID=A0A4P9ZL57_9FUNG|nr:hypothetical protein BJ085DRAFT_39564 [Dimargaris cristalligena]|eukprot:RKP33997.1 hypothetical protein BJ085DRAFT_39564 [Dimargaris cristalligena]